MRARRALFACSLMIAVAVSGCLGGGDGDGQDQPGALTLPQEGDPTTPQERAAFEFDVTGTWSAPLRLGEYGILDGLDVYVDVPLPETEGGNAVNPADPPRAHLGLFLPDIPGCDWAAEDLPSECQVPVIADAGPYYRTPGDDTGSEGDVPAAERGSGRLGEFLISNFVPHGYAVAQISVMGSGLSNHCFDMFGLAEQLGVHHAVEHLGSQPWSNGNVGLIGRSYDGSTPWMAAAHGSEHLKTIVPISGLSGLQDLVTWNGASESRILTFHNVIYGTFGLDSHEIATDAVAHGTCPDWVTAAPMGAAAYIKGDSVVDATGNTYWEERGTFIPGAVANYRGSLYMIHGLRDNNVDPHAGWQGQLALQEAGLDVKSLWGQWYHSYPDRPGEHGRENQEPRTSVRYDWAQDLLEWFDFYLKGVGERPGLYHEIQQADGAWRVETEFPPSDAVFVDVPLGQGMLEVSTMEGGTADLGVQSEDQDTLLGGLSSVTVAVTPLGSGGQVYVELRDGTADSSFGLSYGIMDLRHRNGEFEPVTPGMTYDVEIPLQLFDAVLPAGHTLHLQLAQAGNGFLPPSTPTPVMVDLSGSTLHLSTLERGPESYFEPPAWIEIHAAMQEDDA